MNQTFLMDNPETGINYDPERNYYSIKKIFKINSP